LRDDDDLPDEPEEDGGEEDNLPVDSDDFDLPDEADIPTSLEDGWREKLTDVASVKKVWEQIKTVKERADVLSYATMLDQWRVAAECWNICCRRHVNAKTPSERAQITADFVAMGEAVGGVKRARWMERRRLGFVLPRIHARTKSEMEHQIENGEEPTHPSFNTVSRRWFPSEATVRRQQEQERKQAAKLLEAEYQNKSEQERRQQLMEAADQATEAKQRLAQRERDWEYERSGWQSGQKRLADEIAAMRDALAERDAEIARLRAALAASEPRQAANDASTVPPPDPHPSGTEPAVEPDTASPPDSPVEPTEPPPEATESQEAETRSEPLGEPAERTVDRHAAVYDMLPNPAGVGITPNDLNARLGFNAGPILEELIIAKRAGLQDTTSANPFDWKWTRYPNEAEPVEPPQEQETTGELPTEQHEVIYWTELHSVSSSQLCERVLTATDLPDLTIDKLPVEEKEAGFDRRGHLKDKDLDLVARRLKLATIRCAKLLGCIEEFELLKTKPRQWFADRRHLPVGQVIRAAHPPIPPVGNED
jgi:hypothetical protein